MQAITHAKKQAPFVIEVEHVSFSFGTFPVLEDVSLTVSAGEYLGLIGPNGAGKTTLLKIMLGLLPASTGSVRLFGTDIRAFRAWPRIGYVPQKKTAAPANFPATVEEVVTMGRVGRRGFFHWISSEDRGVVRRSLKIVGLWELKDRLIGELSGGQEQRVFIARALAGEPEILLLDEPTTGVDEDARRNFYALLQSLRKGSNLTLMLISHDIQAVVREATEIACINRTLTYHGCPEDFASPGAPLNLEHPHTYGS